MSILRAHRSMALLLATLTAFQPPAPAAAEHIFARIDRLVQQATYHGTEPESGFDCAVETLAENIDWLEHHIDTYGSIVAKSPDIWGEARLTKFRDEYEKIMFRELTGFQVKINASIAQSDSAFLAQALALSAAAGGTPIGTPSTGTTYLSSTSITTPPAYPALVDAGSAPFPNAEGKSTFSKFGIESGEKISLEPVIELDQLSRYLQHLHELRRINEGDDTSDSPGYSLNLVRIPVSILPGKLTRTGFGAEITVTCTPVITDDLMPTTFHNLAVNDMVDVLGLPLVRVTEGRLYGTIDPVVEALPRLREGMREIEDQLRNQALSDDERILGISAIAQRLLKDELVRTALIDALQAAGTVSLTPRTAQSSSAFPPNTTASLIQSNRINKLAMSTQAQSVRTKMSDVMRRLLEAAGSGEAKAINTVYDIVPANNQRLRSKILNFNALSEVGRIGVLRDFLLEYYSRLIKAIDDQKPELVAELLVKTNEQTIKALEDAVGQFGIEVEKTVQAVPTGRARRALYPINPTFVFRTIGVANLIRMSKDFEPAYTGRYIRWNGGRGEKCEQRVDLLDAQRFLQAELEAAHELLSQPENVSILHDFASPASGLARQIRSGYLTPESCPKFSVEAYRHCFFRRLRRPCSKPLQCLDGQPCQPIPYDEQFAEELPNPCPTSTRLEGCLSVEGDEEARNTVEALAWALVVESALLNERLNLDVRKIAKSKEAYQLDTNRDYLFFLPETVMSPTAGLEELQGEFQEATNVFKEYVRVRWPIHVFAIDPREQDQNVADVSARKRELQFALALGFVTGQIGVNSLTQYSRELQTQIETIALNRTVVGFGHGDDTFGWRFQPRVQGLYVPNNCGAVREILCGVSRDYDLRHRQLEPGQRECTAIVLMPSFVPYADFDIRSNWYKLTNPKNSALTMRDTLRLSRAITTMRQSQSQCMECAELYRDNEVHRLLKRVDQLDRELPLQSQRVLVPYENTLGGFEMFNTGVTDLSPELIGWYGAPGVVISDKGCNQFKCGCAQQCSNGGLAPLVTECVKQAEGQPPKLVEVPQALPICEGEGTTLFLVGDNFSVHETKVIAGGVCIPHVQLVSRQVMRVTIPSCVQTVALCENGKQHDYVAIYLATPYGITNHLHVPVRTQLSAESKSQIEQAVATQVKEAVAKLELPPRHLAIAPALEQENTVFLNAECNTPTCTSFKCTLAARSALQVRYTYQGDPRLDGKPVTLYVAPCLGDKFLGPLHTVQHFQRLTSGEAFEAFGNAQEEVLEQIGLGLRREDFKQGKATLKLVYYALVDGQQVPERLLAEIPVEVTLQLPEVGSATLSITKSSNNAALQWQSSEAQSNAAPPAAMPLPTESGLRSVPIELGPALDPPASKPTAREQAVDCRCGQSPARSPAQFASANLPLAPRRLPVQPAQFQPIEQLPGPLPLSDELATPDVSSKLLAEIEILKQQLAAQQATIQAALEQEGEIVPGPASAAAGQSVINLNIQQPSGHLAWISDQLEFPLAHRMFVRGRECWRNVRDQLPCN